MSLLLASQPEKIDPTAFVAPGAVVVGDVTLGPQASLWFGAVARGDAAPILIGARTNVQDGCILHADAGQPCLLGQGVSLGHAAIVHAATVEDDVLIGMRATVLNGAHIGRGSLVAAGAVVPPGAQIPPGSVVMGLPAKVVRSVTDKDRARIRQTAEHYAEAGAQYRTTFGSAAPLLPLHPPAAAGVGADAGQTIRLLRGLGVFDGLNDAELGRVAALCWLADYRQGDVVMQQGAAEAEIYIVRTGLLEVSVGELSQEGLPAHTVVNLGEGQVVGEMALIDHGPRSATVRCISGACTLLVMDRQAFEALCDADHHIGLVVYRNLAADLSFKMRHRHLTRR